MRRAGIIGKKNGMYEPYEKWTHARQNFYIFFYLSAQGKSFIH
jgi:hypothetical protein